MIPILINKKWLKPAVDWLQKNMPDSLNNVYQNGKLVQTAATAEQWVRLLNAWKQNKAK